VSALLEVRRATVRYPRGGAAGGPLLAVDGVDLAVQSGEILALVGESGCGKSSLGRAILGLEPLSGGEILWRGRRIDALSRTAYRPLRRELQLVFQDPVASFDPRMTIAASVGEPLRSLAPALPAGARAARAHAVLGEVAIGGDEAQRYPHQLSGGQLQRAGIARALVVDPALLVCDEPVSALDVSVQGQVVNLLAKRRRDHGLACLFISHNLAVVAHLADRILVMQRGRIVESGTCDEILLAPRHPHTRMLLESVPSVDPRAARRLISARAAAQGAGDPRGLAS
jgi:ABC-type glutathione transport system ATPase component